MTTSGGQTLGAWLLRQLNLVQWCLLSSAYYCSFFFFTYRYVCHFTCTKQKVPDNRFTGHSRIVSPGYGTSFMALF